MHRQLAALCGGLRTSRAEAGLAASTLFTSADRVGPYYLARLFMAIPLRVIQGLLFASIM